MKPSDIDKFISTEILIREKLPKGKVVEGVLYFKDMKTRNIMVKLPFGWFEYQLLHSVMVLVKSTVGVLDDFHREYLRDSLKYMVQSYENGVNPKGMKSVLILPNEAFLSRYF